jgi:type I restriction-modification system DNA methylase subunit
MPAVLLFGAGRWENAGQFRTPRHLIDFLVDVIPCRKE